jgi:O-acetyl-ADP-ribose deacetylase
MNKEVLERITVRQGDITRVQVDAIVNAANRSLLGGGGVDGAIHRAAGPQLAAECRTLGGCPPGEARITKGYRLPARHVIHTVGPVYRGRAEDARLLRGCYLNSLDLANRNKLARVAFPAISCGAYGYPILDACRIAVDTCLEFLELHAFPEQIVFILFSDNDRTVYEHYLASRTGGSP